MSKEILINQLFAGKYLDEGENIGHEVINMFKDDNGNHNLFITPSGRVSGHDLKYILFVRNVSARKTVEVVGLAKGIYRITPEEVKSIRYAGVSLEQIFSNNIYHGDTDIFTEHITFRAEKILTPSQRIFITIGDVSNNGEYTLRLHSKRQVIIPQGMREYYSDNIDNEAYNELISLVENCELWNDNTTERLFPDGAIHSVAPSFLEVIRKEDDENVFSNLLSYYFEYSHRSFQKFAADILNITDMSISFDLYREAKNRIDIWIEGEKDIIVIENKIKSGINGISGDEYSQLNKYYETAEKEAAKNNKQTHYFIFAPDYSRFDLSQFGMKDVYKIIRYSEIYKFFLEETETYIVDPSFPVFIRGLKRHTLSFSELQFDIMRSRLLRKINLLHN